MGYPIFRQAATELVLGEDSPAIVNKLVSYLRDLISALTIFSLCSVLLRRL